MRSLPEALAFGPALDDVLSTELEAAVPPQLGLRSARPPG